MKQDETDAESEWQKTPVPNLVRYVSSGILFARLKVKGKLIRRSLKTKTLSVAKLRLNDLEKHERQMAEHSAAFSEGKMTFDDALQIYRERLKGDSSLKPRTKEHREERISVIRKTWPALGSMDIRKLTKADCLNWAASYTTSAVNFNKTVQTLRGILEIAVESGVRYDNPARFIKSMKVRQKPLQLPTRDQFSALVESVRKINKRFSHDAADLIEFLAYGGFRIGEVEHITWADCNFERGEILVRGDPKTGTKNWSVRTVQMIDEMRHLLERIRQERPNESKTTRVVKVLECNGSLAAACSRLGIVPHITHHDLRHLFATTSIEAGVDIPTIAHWLGHKDGGALAMKVYGHLRNQHSAAMAKKVSFAASSTKAVQAPPAEPPLQKRERPPLVADDRKKIAQAKSKYGYPWWASQNPIEVFWGQLNENVQIVPVEKYHQCAVRAMGREIFSDEFNDRQSLQDEFTERVSKEVLAGITGKLRVKTEKPALEMG